MNVYSGLVNNLQFVDDIDLIAETLEDLQMPTSVIHTVRNLA